MLALPLSGGQHDQGDAEQNLDDLHRDSAAAMADGVKSADPVADEKDKPVCLATMVESPRIWLSMCEPSHRTSATVLDGD